MYPVVTLVREKRAARRKLLTGSALSIDDHKGLLIKEFHIEQAKIGKPAVLFFPDPAFKDSYRRLDRGNGVLLVVLHSEKVHCAKESQTSARQNRNLANLQEAPWVSEGA